MEDQRIQSLPWLPEVEELVKHRLDQLADRRHDRRPELEREMTGIDDKIAGWSQSLANRELDPNVRSALEAEWAKASARKQEIENLLAEQAATAAIVDEIVDPDQIVERIRRLADVLASGNPTTGNLELSLHIDRIDCFSDGKAVMRTSKLGALTGAVPLLAAEDDDANNTARDGGSPAAHRATPRRRGRRRFDEGQGDGDELRALADMAADPNRFAGLPDDWFWEDVFVMPKRQSWAEEHGLEVAKLRAAGKTIQQLAEHFGKTPPTIRDALRHAAKQDEALDQLPKKMPRRRWHEDHALEVAELKAQGMSTIELARHFGKSDTTIRHALKHAEECSDHGPDAEVGATGASGE